MKILKYLLIGIFSLCYSCAPQIEPPTPVGPVPTARQLVWQEMEYYGFLHFNMNTFTNIEWGEGSEKPSQFNPSELDAMQWARIAKEAGMKGLIITAKHHDGFCLWPSKYTEHSVKNSSWKNGKGDVIKELSEACKAYGIKMGVYLSPWDRNNADYGKPEYVTVFHNQLRELLTNYGDIFEVWFDGANGGSGYYGGANETRKIDNKTYYQWDKVISIVRELQPNAVIFGDGGPGVRWVGNEEGWANETNWSLIRDEVHIGYPKYKELRSGHEDGTNWVPAECDVSIRPGWYYHPYEDHKVKTLPHLLNIYYQSVGRNASLLLNLPVDNRGLVHENDEKQLMALKNQLALDFEVNLAEGQNITATDTRGNNSNYAVANLNDGNKETYWATNDSVIKASITIEFDSPTTMNRILLQEYIPLGQRVQNFKVEAEIDGKWKEIDRQTTIGYKRILRFKTVRASKVKVSIIDAKGPPLLSNIEIYNAPKLLVAPILKRDKSGMLDIIKADASVDIYYTLDGSEPVISSKKFETSFLVEEPIVIKAIAYDDITKKSSEVTSHNFDISKKAWNIIAVSSGELSSADKMIDDDSNTSWSATGKKDLSQFVTVDLGKDYTLSGFTYLPMQDRWIKGVITNYEFLVSVDNKTWQKVVAGEFGNIWNNPIEQKIEFNPVKGRYFKIKAIKIHGGDNNASFAEIGVITNKFRKMSFKIFIVLLFIVILGFAQNKTDDLQLYDNFEAISSDNIFKTKGYYNWGNSIIKEKNGKYHLFYSRWKKEYGFLGWLTHSEIAHAISKSPSGPWKYKETVLKGRGEGYWDAITAHNPKIKYFEGKYYLYYISTNMGGQSISEDKLVESSKTGYNHPNWKILRSNQRTGVAVANIINGPWIRLDKPLIEPSGPITTLTVNPAIDKGKDGKYYLVVKGNKPNEKRFIRNQAVAISEHPDGPFVLQEKPVIDYMDTEDMSLWYDKERERFYGVFHAEGFIGLVTSKDGINWEKSNEFVLMQKKVSLKDGSILIPDRLERPFIYHENGLPKVLSLSVRKNDESYGIFIPIKENPYPIPNRRQLAWQEAELGVVFHYDLHVFDGKKYSQGANRIDPVLDYQIFNPKNLDTDQWVKAAKDAGARFAILTATHETGFALYQSDVNPYSLKAVNWRDGKGDIVADFIASCKKYDIKPGIYLGIRWNSFLGVHDFKVNGEGAFKENRQKWYNHMVEGMVKEICTNYGELFEIWFDGGADHPDNGAPDVLPIVRRYQPNCLFYHNGQLAEARWGGSESGTVSYPSWATFPYRTTGAGESAKINIAKDGYKLLKEGDPNGKYWMPAMSDAPLRGYNGRHEWFWEPKDEAHIFPLENLMEMYYKSVGRNSTLIIGLTPDDNGLIPNPDVERLKEWGDEIERRLSTPLASTYIGKDKILLKLDRPSLVNHVIIQEDIRYGESIRKYQLEGLVDKKWIVLSTGESIGQKRIEYFENVKVSNIRLKVIEADRKIRIKNMSAYFVTNN